MNSLRKLILLTLILLTAAATTIILTPKAYAASVYTAKEDGTQTDKFAMGEKVRIIAYSSSCPYNIVIIDSNGITRYTVTSNTPKYDQIWDNITDKPGWWEVKAGTASTSYATAFYNVIPETPLGTISMIIACFAAFGMSIFRKRIKLKLPQ